MKNIVLFERNYFLEKKYENMYLSLRFSFESGNHAAVFFFNMMENVIEILVKRLSVVLLNN
jgi:hypothetical protein